MYSRVFSSSGVRAVAAVFGGGSVDVFVCATDSALEVRHMTRNTAITIARMVIFLTFPRKTPLKIGGGPRMQEQDENGETLRPALKRVKLPPSGASGGGRLYNWSMSANVNQEYSPCAFGAVRDSACLG